MSEVPPSGEVVRVGDHSEGYSMCACCKKLIPIREEHVSIQMRRDPDCPMTTAFYCFECAGFVPGKGFRSGR